MNVILVMLDSLRKDHVGVYGNDWIKTPSLDALARESLRLPGPTRSPSPPSRRGVRSTPA